MKTIKTLLNQTPVIMGEWDGRLDIIACFEDIYITEKEFYEDIPPNINVEYRKENIEKLNKIIPKYDKISILFANYTQDGYEGDAWVLFEKDGKLFEIHGSHCSCYGLEGQWDPEEITLKELNNRIENSPDFGKRGYTGENFRAELLTFLGLHKGI